MKRITYISRLSAPLSHQAIHAIGVNSSRNNQQVGITGLLVYFNKIFFQMMEGEEREIDRLFDKIKQDTRHTDVLCLKAEYDISERFFPSWSMKTINLDNTTDELVRPVKILLQTVVESHTIIERYTQPTVLKILNSGINPISVAPSPVERIILFADIVSYSTISEKRATKNMLLMLNTYFEVCCRIIVDKGGEVNKFLGDGIMANFSPAAADNAIEACLEIMAELQNLRRNAAPTSPLKLLHSGFGLAQGTVIEGNMGSPVKMDYTIIGDAVNTAARLEQLTREVKHSLVLTELVKNGARKPWHFISLGHYSLKGKLKSREIYTIDHPLIHDFVGKVPI